MGKNDMQIMSKFITAAATLTLCVVATSGCTKEEPATPAPPPAGASATPATSTATDAESQKVQAEDEAAAKRAL